MEALKQILKKVSKVRKNFLALASVFVLSACDECLTYQEYVSEGKDGNCLLCPLFTVLTESAAKVANNSWNMFASELSYVVMYVTAIYIAFFTLKMVGSFGEKAFADYLMNNKTGVVMLGFKLAVIYQLLNSNFIVANVLAPLLEAGLKVGEQLSATTTSIGWGVNSSGGTAWDSLFSMLNTAIQKFNDQVYEHIALGNAMICHSTKGFLFSWYWLMLCYGIIFFIFGWFLLAFISFFIVDIIINLAIGAMLLPFGIAFAISEKTKPYTTKIWQIFLGVFFNFIMIGVILGLSVQLIELAMGKMDENNVPSSGINSFLGEISSLLDANNVKQVSEILWNSGCLLLAIVCFWLTSKLIGQIKELSSAISDAIGSKLTSSGEAVGNVAVSSVVGVSKKAGKYVTNSVEEGAKYALDAGARRTGIDKAIRNVQGKATTVRGVLTGTGKEGYKAWWRK